MPPVNEFGFEYGQRCDAAAECGGSDFKKAPTERNKMDAAVGHDSVERGFPFDVSLRV